jgi:cytidylate kinase
MRQGGYEQRLIEELAPWAPAKEETMPSRVITIARSIGAGGEEVGRSVANELGFRYMDSEIIRKAAERAGVPVESVAQAEYTPPMLQRIAQSLAASSASPEPEIAAVSTATALLEEQPSEELEPLIPEIIREVASLGNVVIVAHGAGIALTGMDGLLRVFVTGSVPQRASRYGQFANLDPRNALRAVRESDRQREAFLRRFYNIRRELPTLYDLVVNTDEISFTAAGQLIVGLARS